MLRSKLNPADQSQPRLIGRPKFVIGFDWSDESNSGHHVALGTNCGRQLNNHESISLSAVWRTILRTNVHYRLAVSSLTLQYGHTAAVSSFSTALQPRHCAAFLVKANREPAFDVTTFFVRVCSPSAGVKNGCETRSGKNIRDDNGSVNMSELYK